jgi:hypothetical protein
VFLETEIFFLIFLKFRIFLKQKFWSHILHVSLQPDIMQNSWINMQEIHKYF